uniref:Uncharacterized protein n=1 Tax=Arundo donax TaxID=35708 RepID=A0A0A9CLC4_ARUDO
MRRLGCEMAWRMRRLGGEMARRGGSAVGTARQRPWRLPRSRRGVAGSRGASSAGSRSSVDGGDRDGSCALRDNGFDDDELLPDDGEGIYNGDAGERDEVDDAEAMPGETADDDRDVVAAGPPRWGGGRSEAPGRVAVWPDVGNYGGRSTAAAHRFCKVQDL